MKKFLSILFLFIICCLAQKVGPQNTYGLVAKYFGISAPGSVTGNLSGDLYVDTTNHNQYYCGATSGTPAPACTSVGVGNWTLTGNAVSLSHYFSGPGTANLVHGLGTYNPLTTCQSVFGASVDSVFTVDANTSSVSVSGPSSVACVFSYAPSVTGFGAISVALTCPSGGVLGALDVQSLDPTNITALTTDFSQITSIYGPGLAATGFGVPDANVPNLVPYISATGANAGKFCVKYSGTPQAL